MNISRRTAKFGRKFVLLSETEFALLEYLCRHEDRLIPKAELLKNVWGTRSRQTRTVDIYVNRLRNKLKRSGCRDDYIRTLHGRGYCFVSEPEK